MSRTVKLVIRSSFVHNRHERSFLGFKHTTFLLDDVKRGKLCWWSVENYKNWEGCAIFMEAMKREKEYEAVKRKKREKNPIWESHSVHGPAGDRCRRKDLLSVIRKLSAVSFTVTHTHFSTTTSNLFNLLPSFYYFAFLLIPPDGSQGQEKLQKRCMEKKKVT
jgi:hypothetical protein